MAVKKIPHYSLTTPASVYDEDAMTALELAARTAGKVNECVDMVNNIPEYVKNDVQEHIDNGEFDKQISDYANDLEGRLDNLIRNIDTPADQLDAELIDMRYGADGVTYGSAGKAMRDQFAKSLTMHGLIDTVDKLPDVNEITTAGVHILHFSEGATDIPAGLPFTAWEGRIAALFTIKNTYHRQILFNDKHVYTRNAGAAASWGEWSCLNEIGQNGGAGDNDYTTKLPDVNDADIGFYSLHFADGSANIPANLPWSTWAGKVATLLTVQNEYRRQFLFSDSYIYTRYRGANAWSMWKNITGKEVYTVDINGGGDYTSILKALKAHPTNTRLIVKSGVYDIANEYKAVYGQSYFENYTGYEGGNVFDRGLFLGDGVELIGEGFPRLIFAYAGSNTAVKNKFAVISTSQNNVVEGFSMVISDNSCRYIIHDDFATAAGSNVFRHLHFEGYPELGTVIGGGFGTSNTYIIDKCTFTNIKESIAIAYHNNAADGKNRLYITDCHCVGSIDLKHYGVAAQKSLAYVSGCVYTNLTLRHGDQSRYPNENISLVSHGNVEQNNTGSTKNTLSQSAIEKLINEKTAGAAASGMPVFANVKSTDSLDDLTENGAYWWSYAECPFDVPFKRDAAMMVCYRFTPTTQPDKWRCVQTIYTTEGEYTRYRTTTAFTEWRFKGEDDTQLKGIMVTPESVKINAIAAKCATPFKPLEDVDTSSTATPTFIAGNEYKGIPYSAQHYCSLDVFYNLTLDALFSMFNHEGTAIYNYTKTGKNGDVFTGGVCSSFVSWITGQPIFYTTYDMVKMLNYKEINGVEDIEIGDVLICHSSFNVGDDDHAMIVSNIIADVDGVTSIEIAEMWNPLFRKVVYTAAEFMKLLDGTSTINTEGTYRVGRFDNQTIRSIKPLSINSVMMSEYGNNVYYDRGSEIWVTTPDWNIHAISPSGSEGSIDTTIVPKENGLAHINHEFGMDMSEVGEWKISCPDSTDEVLTIKVIDTGTATLANGKLTLSGYEGCTPCGYAVVGVKTGASGEYEPHIDGDYSGTRLTIHSKNDPRYAGALTSDTLTLNVSGISKPTYVGYYVRVFYETGYGQAHLDTNVAML